MSKQYAPTPLLQMCLFCNKRDFMLSFSHERQADIIETFNSMPRI